MVLAGIIDVTSRHKAEQEKEQHRRELERSNADLDEFAHVASHDLKAPLRAIGHLAEWISEDIAPYASAETLENLALLKGRVSRLQQLLNGLLGYARVGNPQRPVEMVDVAEMVRDIVAITPPPQGFAVACQGPMGSVRTYRIPLRAVLENLISNALKHHDRATGRVDISMCRRGRLVEIRVADDGPGISPRFHERIFVIFQTLASRDEVETNGIGLAIVKKKVESHGGTVRVESQPPQRGTCFVFTWAEALE
jgi:light-regulated signal transduction histidine kinase (bacteriophytochrome)